MPVTEVANFFVGVFGRVASGVLSAYAVRLIDKFLHKNNRHE